MLALRGQRHSGHWSPQMVKHLWFIALIEIPEGKGAIFEGGERTRAVGAQGCCCYNSFQGGQCAHHLCAFSVPERQGSIRVAHQSAPALPCERCRAHGRSPTSRAPFLPGILDVPEHQAPIRPRNQRTCTERRERYRQCSFRTIEGLHRRATIETQEGKGAILSCQEGSFAFWRDRQRHRTLAAFQTPRLVFGCAE